MKEKEYLHRLMHTAFVIIRAEAYERKDKKAFRICDLLHNVPLKILNIEKEEEYKIIYQELLNYVNSNGMKTWLDSNINEIERMKKYKSDNINNESNNIDSD